jgi:hypothetical protein
MHENNNQFNGNVSNRGGGGGGAVIINSVITVNDGSELPATPTVVSLYYIVFIY